MNNKQIIAKIQVANKMLKELLELVENKIEKTTTYEDLFDCFGFDYDSDYEIYYTPSTYNPLNHKSKNLESK